MAKKQLTVIGNIKPITTNAVPTTANLKKGEWAYGTIGGKNRMFGNPAGTAIVEFSPADAAMSVKDVQYNATTAVLTVTYTDNTTSAVNLPKENFLSAASFNPTTKILTLTLVDNTTVTVDMKDLVDVYEAAASGGLEIVNGNQFKIKAGSVTEAMLESALATKVNAAKTMTAAASQTISVAGTTGAVTATINASAAKTEGGLKVTSGTLELDEANIEIVYSVTEI